MDSESIAFLPEKQTVTTENVPTSSMIDHQTNSSASPKHLNTQNEHFSSGTLPPPPPLTTTSNQISSIGGPSHKLNQMNQHEPTVANSHSHAHQSNIAYNSSTLSNTSQMANNVSHWSHLCSWLTKTRTTGHHPHHPHHHHTDRPNVCADRVIYRPNADSEDQVVASLTSRSSIHERRSRGLKHTLSKRKWLVKVFAFLLAFLLAAVLLETVHYFTSSQCAFFRQNNSQFAMHLNGTARHYHIASNSSENDQELLDNEGRAYPWSDIRLPSFMKPLSYEIFLEPNMDTFYNTGNVTIELMLAPNTSTNFLVMHSKKLNITKVRFAKFLPNKENKDHLESITVISVRECARLEQLYIELQHQITPDFRYQLVVEFQRQLVDDLEGFYISSYYNTVNKKKHYLLTTHFEPTLARTAFPCFDEPAMKATFQLRMLHDPTYTVYFNTEIIERTNILNGDRKTLSISETTVPMSTYLVAFVLCDFTVNGVQNDEGIHVRAIVPINQNQHTQYALQFASKVLTFYKDFFKVAYPLRKLDLIAVPDFGAGAMENWGIITFRTTTLLYDAKESSSEMQEQVATVIAHEIAHQWFGNLVTMNWWNELWLNEGFASYVENLGVDYVHPEWRMLDQFVISTTQHALAMDSLLSSHPIHATVANPAEIEAIFDMISYKKGSCLIRMIEHFLGKEKLQLGLEKYLNEYMYRTAKTSQLWECMSEVAGHLPINVSSIMDTWIQQQGYPVISAEWDTTGNYIIVSQQRYVSSIGLEDFNKQKENDPLLQQTWIVPLTLVDSNSPNNSQLYWLNGSSLKISLQRDKIKWFKLNHQQSGFYRVNYDQSIWRGLIDQLVNCTPTNHFMSAADRAGLIDDAFSLMRIGHLDVDIAMDLTRYFEFGEYDYVPWETIMNHFGVIDTLMWQYPTLHRYTLRLIHTLLNRLSWHEKPTDGMFEKKLRAMMLRSAVYYGDKKVVQQANEHFHKWMNQGIKMAANVRDTVYHAGVQYGNDIEWYHCWNNYLNTTDASEKRLMLAALGSTRNHYLLAYYLGASLNRSLIRTQDTPFVIQVVARNPIGRTIAWNFVKMNWDYILSVFGQGSFSIDAIISEVTWHFSTEYEYQEAKQFFGSVNLGSGKQAVKQSLEKIRANIYWKEHIESKVIRWLHSRQL